MLLPACRERAVRTDASGRSGEERWALWKPSPVSSARERREGPRFGFAFVWRVAREKRSSFMRVDQIEVVSQSGDLPSQNKLSGYVNRAFIGKVAAWISGVNVGIMSDVVKCRHYRFLMHCSLAVKSVRLEFQMNGVRRRLVENSIK